MRSARSVLAFAAAMMFASAAGAAAMPPEVAERIREGLPMAFYGFPRTAATKICPIKSETRRQPDRTVVVDLKTTQLVLTGFSEDGKCAEASIPGGKDGGGRVKRWFKTEDVLSLGIKKLSPTNASTRATTFVYSPYGAKRPTLLGCLGAGVLYADFGIRKVGKETFTMALLGDGGATADGEVYSSRLVYLKEPLPTDDESNYYDRIANLIAEEPYQPGVHWDNSVHPLLVNNGNGGCAAFVTDFAKYVFDAGNFNAGEKYDNAADIRAGDVLALKGHFMAVLSRDGDKLYMMDGNCNSKIRRTATTYTVSKGVWCDGGVPRPENFLHGFHYLKSAPDPKLARKLPK